MQRPPKKHLMLEQVEREKRTTSSEVDAFSYYGNKCKIGRPEGPG